MKKPERKLGRGLGALLPRKSENQAAKAESDNIQGSSADISGRPLMIQINNIEANKKQPREIFNEESLSELSASIKEQGILQPLVVRKIEDNYYELIAGERRMRAAKMAGLVEVPVVIMDITDNRMLEAALVENLQRQDLNCIEIGHAYEALINELELTHEEVAKRLGVSRVSVTNILRLLTLPREVQEIVSRGTISMGHARALLSLDTPLQQINIARKIVDDGLTVREIERMVKSEPSSSKKATGKHPKSGQSKNAYIRDYEDRLRHKFGTKVKIDDKDGKGTISIEYYSNEDFGRILALLGATED